VSVTSFSSCISNHMRNPNTIITSAAKVTERTIESPEGIEHHPSFLSYFFKYFMFHNMVVGIIQYCYIFLL